MSKPRLTFYMATTGLSDKEETWRIEAGTRLSERQLKKLEISLPWLIEQGYIVELEEPDDKVQ